MDRRTYTFSRGSDMVVVLTNGNYSEAVPRPAAYNLSGLASFAGDTLCDALRSGVSERPHWARRATPWCLPCRVLTWRQAVQPRSLPRSGSCAGPLAAWGVAPPCACLSHSRCAAVSPVPQYCVEVSEEGVALVQPSPTDEPLLLVHNNWVHSDTFFIMLHNRPVRTLSHGCAGRAGRAVHAAAMHGFTSLTRHRRMRHRRMLAARARWC